MLENELVIGLVCALGTDSQYVENRLRNELSSYVDKIALIRLSKLISDEYPEVASTVSDQSEEVRIKAFMDAGNKLRSSERHERGDAVAIYGLAAVSEVRSSWINSRTDDVDISSGAYILNSLKHPDEVSTLRKIYGKRFILIAIYQSEDERKRNLARKIAKTRKEPLSDEHLDTAQELLERDLQEKGKKLGQNVLDTFPLADLFVDATENSSLDFQIRRFIEIIFSHPFRTPTKEEQAMFHAMSASRRSADLARQVGAAIVGTQGQIISSGCNEVPLPGGGSFWEELDGSTVGDNRDHKIGFDSTARWKHLMLSEIFKQLRESGWLSEDAKLTSDEDLARESISTGGALKSARVSSILEFGRIIHAEMNAILESARIGRSIQNAELYCTTFPCHMCARHIIGAGIRRVVYIEPYPKSLAKDLYPNEISLSRRRITCAADEMDSSVHFEPFVGVAPRRYFDVFEMIGERKDNAGMASSWTPQTAILKLPVKPYYRDTEAAFVRQLFSNPNHDKLPIEQVENGEKS